MAGEGPRRARIEPVEPQLLDEPMGSLLEAIRRLLQSHPIEAHCPHCSRPVKITAFNSQYRPERGEVTLMYEYGHTGSPPLGRVEVKVCYYGCRAGRQPRRWPLSRLLGL